MTPRTEFLSDLIGKRWAANGKGLDTFDCWHLAVHVEWTLFERVLPSVAVPDDPSWAWMLETIGSHPEHERWQERPSTDIERLSSPDGALVLMARSVRAAHIGVWLKAERGIIHCDQTGGVMFDDPVTLRAAGWKSLRYFEPKAP